MPGIAPNAIAQPLLLFQTFKETTWGTSGAATAKWMGIKRYPELKPYRKITLFDEARGNLATAFNSAQLRKGGEFKVGGEYASYEDLNFQLGAVIGAVTPTGAGPYVYTYVGPTTAQPTFQAYTIEYNQASYAARATGCVGTKLVLKGEAEKVMTYELNGLAQDIDNTWAGPPTSLSDRAQTPIIVPNDALYMDAAGGTIGTTIFSNTLLSYSYTFENMVKYVYTAGSLTPQNWVVGGAMKGTLELDLMYTTQVRTYINATPFAGVNSLIQIKATSGVNIFIINLATQMTDDPALFGNKEGAQTIKLKFETIYDTGAALYNNFTLTNNVATLP